MVTAAACGSPARLTTGPTPVKCQVSLDRAATLFAADGGTGTIQVSTNPECTWSASSSAAWIAGLTPQSGQGSGTVHYSATANPAASAREGQITINDAQLRVQQEPAPCVFDVTPRRHVIDAAGGSGEVSVATASGCRWSASSGAPWITIASGASGNGSGLLRFDVAPNSDAARIGSLEIAGEVSVVEQHDPAPVTPGCAYSLSAPSAAVPASGGAGSVTLLAAPACAWTAATLSPWISVVSGASGSGTGVVSFAVAANAGAARAGALRIANQQFVVAQDASAGCTFTIAPTQQSFTAAGGAGAPVSVTTSTGCAWTAQSDVPWVTVTSGASGSGNGSVQFTVAANSGATRSTLLRIAGQNALVEQQAAAGSCAFAIAPTQQSFAATGGASAPVSVTTTSGCAWTAESDVPWVTITSGGSGTGNGSVQFSVGANSGAARSTVLRIAGQNFLVQQQAVAAVCAYTVTPQTQSIAVAGGSGFAVDVATTPGCSWTAATADPWITLTSGTTGSGSGTVRFAVAANSGVARTGSIQVAGETSSVTQASGCSYSVAPPSRSVGPGTATGQVQVSTSAGCQWTATSNVTWMSITAGSSGTGNGTVEFAADANPGAPRAGTLTIADQIFSVTQGECAFSLSATSATIGSSGGAGQPVNVSAATGCTWTAVSNASWITITSGSSGSGNGTVRYDVAPNLLITRVGTLTIAGQTFTVSQNGLILQSGGGGDR